MNSKRVPWTVLLITLLAVVIAFQGYFIHQLNGRVASFDPPPAANPIKPPSPSTTSPFDPWGRQGLGGFSQDPFAEIERMQKEMDQWFQGNGFFTRRDPFVSLFNGGASGARSDFEIREEADEIVVTGKIPGADESSINVSLNSGTLTISAQTQGTETEENGGSSQRRSFSRRIEKSLTLPGDVDQLGMKTEFEDGVLTVRIPKNPPNR